MMNRRLAIGASVAALAIASGAHAQRANDWISNNRDLGAQRYSPLTQITPANVTQLKQAWVYHMRPAGAPRLLSTEAIPIVVANTMYLPTPYGRVVALDASTGAEKWRAAVPNNDSSSIRGVSYWPG